MAFTPQGKVILLQVPLEIDNKNQIDFSNATEQYNYFISKQVNNFEMENATYIRKDNIIRVPFHIDELWNCNYLMYQNKNFNNKWFYCFITGKTYLNDNCTEISIATDVFQTWQFDYIIHDSFVEREMINVNDDIPGTNLLTEGLETGEFQIDGEASFDELKPYYIVAFTR